MIKTDQFVPGGEVGVGGGGGGGGRDGAHPGRGLPPHRHRLRRLRQAGLHPRGRGGGHVRGPGQEEVTTVQSSICVSFAIEIDHKIVAKSELEQNTRLEKSHCWLVTTVTSVTITINYT